MKKLSILMVSLMVIAGLVTLGIPQMATVMAGETKMEEKADKAAKPAKKPAVRTKQATGVVAKAAADSLTIKRKVKGEEKELTFSVTAKTSVRMGKEKKAIGDVKEGERVTVRYVEDDGKMTARSVTISPPRPAKKAMKEGPPPEKKEEKK
ncbi:MAG: hypothetical protein HYV08_18260 [Deltaproteobacteria bacterium]|nr:hypothetical protein [Deltaproteobacteria bacterium]